MDVPARREVEIITFNNAEGKGAAGAAVGGAGGITEVLGFPTDEKAKKYGTTSGGADGKKQTIEFLPAGSFVRVAMLNGVDSKQLEDYIASNRATVIQNMKQQRMLKCQ